MKISSQDKPNVLLFLASRSNQKETEEAKLSWLIVEGGLPADRIEHIHHEIRNEKEEEWPSNLLKTCQELADSN